MFGFLLTTTHVPLPLFSACVGTQTVFSYFLAYVAEDENETITYCQSYEDAKTVHPSDATWMCKSMCRRNSVVRP